MDKKQTILSNTNCDRSSEVELNNEDNNVMSVGDQERICAGLFLIFGFDDWWLTESKSESELPNKLLESVELTTFSTESDVFDVELFNGEGVVMLLEWEDVDEFVAPFLSDSFFLRLNIIGCFGETFIKLFYI